MAEEPSDRRSTSNQHRYGNRNPEHSDQAEQDPLAHVGLLLASLSMEVYLKEIAWLSEFIGKIERAKKAAA